MLKCHLDYEANTCKIEAKGNIISILTDVTYLIHDIYSSFQSSNPMLGEMFRNMLRYVINDDSSPVWEKADAHKAGEDDVNSVSVLIPEGLRGLLDMLRGGRVWRIRA